MFKVDLLNFRLFTFVFYLIKPRSINEITQDCTEQDSPFQPTPNPLLFLKPLRGKKPKWNLFSTILYALRATWRKNPPLTPAEAEQAFQGGEPKTISLSLLFSPSPHQPASSSLHLIFLNHGFTRRELRFVLSFLPPNLPLCFVYIEA